MVEISFGMLACNNHDIKPGRFVGSDVCALPAHWSTGAVEGAFAVLPGYFCVDYPPPACRTVPHAHCRTMGFRRHSHYCWLKLEQRRRPCGVPGRRLAVELCLATS